MYVKESIPSKDRKSLKVMFDWSPPIQKEGYSVVCYYIWKKKMNTIKFFYCSLHLSPDKDEVRCKVEFFSIVTFNSDILVCSQLKLSFKDFEEVE